MHVLRRLATTAALIGTVAVLPGCAVAQPVPAPYGAGAPANVPADWQEQLAPYGTWTTLPNYGTVWYPTVAVGWRPYTYGNWGWGPVGWTWFSSEPWGFTFNYGRWAWSPVGWVWVPGFVWGPAWVNWYWGSGFVGWAPLGYYSAVPWAQFVFVHDYDFCNHDVHKHYYKNPPHGAYHHEAPPRTRIAQVSRQPIVRVSASQLPNRSFPRRRADVPRTQSPNSSSAPAGSTPFARPRSTGQVGDRAATPEGSGPSPRSFTPRPGSDGKARNPYAPSPPRGYAPEGRSPYASPYAPGVRPPIMRQPQPSGVHPGQPRFVPNAVPRMAPPMQSTPRMAPPTQSAPRTAAPAPSAPRMAPPASPASPPSGYRGQFGSGSPVTGGGQGFGSGRGFSSPGMR